MNSRLDRENFINAINNYEIAKETHDNEIKASKRRKLAAVIISSALLFTAATVGIYQFINLSSQGVMTDFLRYAETALLTKYRKL